MAGYYPQLTVALIDAEGFRQIVPDDSVNIYNVTTSTDEGTLSVNADGVIVEGNIGADPGDVVELSHDTYPLTMRLTLQATQELSYTAVENDITTYIVENLFTDEDDATQADIYIQDTSEATNEPKLLGSVKAGETGQFPFQTTISKTMRVFAVSKGENFLRTENAFTGGTDISITATRGQAASLFDRYADATTTGTTQENLYTYTLPAATLLNDGDKILIEYAGILTANTNTKRVFPKFDGNVLATGQTNTAAATDWALDVNLIRVSNSVLRYSVEFTTTGDYPTIESGEITGLDLDSDDYQIDLDGRSVSAAGEVTAHQGFGIFFPSALTLHEDALLGDGDPLLGDGDLLLG